MKCRLFCAECRKAVTMLRMPVAAPLSALPGGGRGPAHRLLFLGSGKIASCQPHPDTAQNHRTGTVSAVRRRKPTSRCRMTAKAPLCTGMMPLRPEDGTWSKGHHAGRPPLPLLRQHGADNRCPRGVGAVLWYQ